MNAEASARVKQLPPYLFLEIDKARRSAKEQGRDIIDLGVGDPDLPTPQFIVDALCRAAKEKENQKYAFDAGMPELRQAISGWYSRRFGVRLDSDNEILPLIGSKEGIAHFPLAVLDKGGYALIPDPCYPPYRSGVIFAGGRICAMPLLLKNCFLPDLKKIRPNILNKAKIIYVNYPNNPTSGVATDDFYKALVKFSLENNIIIVSDLAYSEICFDGYRPRSILEFDGAKECAIEFHSLSKTYNMTGWRIGWACGNAKLISLLGKIKSNIDSGIFQAVQIAGVSALKSDPSVVQSACKIFQGRRDTLVSGLKRIGFSLESPKATFYVWTKVPRRLGSSIECAKTILEKADIVVTPGVGFGDSGEGFIRFALTVEKERIEEAVERLRKII